MEEKQDASYPSEWKSNSIDSECISKDTSDKSETQLGTSCQVADNTDDNLASEKLSQTDTLVPSVSSLSTCETSSSTTVSYSHNSTCDSPITGLDTKIGYDVQIEHISVKHISEDTALNNADTRKQNIREKHVCPFCGWTFTFKHLFNKHVHRVHSQKLEQDEHTPPDFNKNCSTQGKLEALKSATCLITKKKQRKCLKTYSSLCQSFKSSRKTFLNRKGPGNLSRLLSRKEYTCSHCRVSFASLIWLTRHKRKVHLLKHPQNVTILPHNISQNAINGGNATPKSTQPAKKKKRVCKVCAKVFGSKKERRSHIRAVHKQSTCTSQISKDSSNGIKDDQPQISSQQDTEPEGDITTVSPAKSESPQKGSFEDQQVQYEKMKLVCKKCGSTFVRLKRLLQHLSKRHPTQEALCLECVPCQLDFENLLKLHEHVNRNHRKHPVLAENGMDVSKSSEIYAWEEELGSVTHDLKVEQSKSDGDQNLEHGSCSLEQNFYSDMSWNIQNNSETALDVHTPSKHISPSTLKSPILKGKVDNRDNLSPDLRKSCSVNITDLIKATNQKLLKIGFTTDKWKEIPSNTSPRILTCSFCDFTSTSKQSLKIHKRVQHGICSQPSSPEARAKVKVTNQVSNGKEKSVQLLNDTSKPPIPSHQLKCSHCNFSTTYEHGLKIHMKVKHGISTEPHILPLTKNSALSRRLTCCYCDFTTEYEHGLKVHTKVRHGIRTESLSSKGTADKANKTNKTSFCDKQQTPQSLEKAAETALSLEAFSCMHCSFTTTFERGLKLHQTVKHCVPPDDQLSSDKTLVSIESKDGIDNSYIPLRPNKDKVDAVKTKKSQCQKCSFEALSAAGLKRHEICKHSGKFSNETMQQKQELQIKKEQLHSVQVDPHFPQNLLQTDPSSSEDVIPVQITPDSDNRVTEESSQVIRNEWCCTLCSYKCKYRSILLRHVRHNHRANEDALPKAFLKCSQCSFSSNSLCGLKRHMFLGHKPSNSLISSKTGTTHNDPSMCTSVCKEQNSKVVSPRAKIQVSPPKLLGKKQDLSCPYCDFRSDMKWTLSVHLRIKHGRNFQQRAAPLMESSANSSLEDDQCNSSSMLPTLSPSDHAFSSLGARVSSPTKPVLQSSDTYLCEHCPYTCKFRKSILAHKQFHRPNRKAKFVCKYCSFWATSQIKLEKHLKLHISLKVSQTKDTEEHMTKSSREEAMSVQETDDLASSGSSCIIRAPDVRGHSNKCRVGKSNANLYKPRSSYLSQTQPSILKRITKYKCNKCPAELPSFHMLRHENHHGSKMKYSCTYCDYSAATVSTIQHHMKLHQMEGKHLQESPSSVFRTSACSSDFTPNSAEESTLPTLFNLNNALKSPSQVRPSVLRSKQFKKINSTLSTSLPSERINNGEMPSVSSEDPPSPKYQRAQIPDTPSSGVLVTKKSSINNSGFASTNDNFINRDTFVSANSNFLNRNNSFVNICNNCSAIRNNFCTCIGCPQHSHQFNNRCAASCCSIPYSSTSNPSQNFSSCSSSSETYQCRMCPFTSSIREDVQVHMWRHGSQDNFHCRFCSFTTDYPSVLYNHNKLHLKSEKDSKAQTFMYFGECQIWKKGPEGHRELLFSCDLKKDSS